ncbi:IS66 family transposase [Novosphingobium sp. P6W]|uniref:IS66 family transposase n=1 Tax=Novosphingobium sp. P6W TaxID=1609758 RepID=UPI0005C2B7DA|nr:IS66 family transposase [Novosphingobium sp. P6W]AXB76653.1 IS66 family transposase [Novosphingobium sp. P6W]AXB78491.1 IS66 family transposase [Novosphingobium sp. P6W]KIS32419.1 transposase [Novosphingobium sp. P6W]KIS33486.1 transposase [Novosphingobium sp. P6W]
MPAQADDLPEDMEQMAALVRELQAENAQLRALLKGMAHQAFGSRSERASAILGDQGILDLGDLVTTPAAAANDDGDAEDKPAVARPRRKRGVMALPAHIERVERVIDPDTLDCPCCAGTLHRIGEDASEALDWVPAIVRVIRTVRPRYACRKCREGVVQAPAPRRAIPGSMVTTSTLAWMATARFAWSIPLNRQLQMLAGQGVILDRALPSRWMRKIAWWVKALYDRLLAYIHSQSRIFCDETRMPVLEKGRRRTRTTQFWAHACDDGPWSGPAHPAVVYIHARGRRHAEAFEQLARYQGVIQVDGYGAYKALVRSGPGRGKITLAFCLAHARRKFVDAYRKSPSPVAAAIIALISQVYVVEARVRKGTAAQRLQARLAETADVMAKIKAQIDTMLPRLSPKSDLAKAMRYTLNHWKGLTLFLEDGRIEVDTNTVERGMRNVAQGRKSSLFAGSEEGAQTWAVMASLLQTARLGGLDPYTWLNDVLERIVTGAVKINELDILLPWNWRPAAEPVKALAA